MEPQYREMPVSTAFFYVSLGVTNKKSAVKYHLFSMSHIMESLSMVPRGPYGDRYSVSRAIGLFIYSLIHSHLSESPVKELSHEMSVGGGDIRSPSTEPHADGRPTYYY
jgi:hypothetical protein